MPQMNGKDRDLRKPGRKMGRVPLPFENNREFFRNRARKNSAKDDALLNTVRAPRGWLSVAPKSRVVPGIDELDMDSHPIAGFAHRAFDNIRNTELAGDLRNVIRGILETLCRRPRDDFQISDPRKSGQDFLLNTIGKISVRFIFTEIFKRQDGNGFAQNRPSRSDFLLGHFVFYKLFWRFWIAGFIRIEINDSKGCAVFYFARSQLV